jgi:hypothetical protein
MEPLCLYFARLSSQSRDPSSITSRAIVSLDAQELFPAIIVVRNRRFLGWILGPGIEFLTLWKEIEIET